MRDVANDHLEFGIWIMDIKWSEMGSAKSMLTEIYRFYL